MHRRENIAIIVLLPCKLFFFFLRDAHTFLIILTSLVICSVLFMSQLVSPSLSQLRCNQKWGECIDCWLITSVVVISTGSSVLASEWASFHTPKDFFFFMKKNHAEACTKINLIPVNTSPETNHCFLAMFVPVPESCC